MFPTVWCTLGYYTNAFKIEIDLEMIFNKYRTLDQTFFHIPCYEIELGTSHYRTCEIGNELKYFHYKESRQTILYQLKFLVLIIHLTHEVKPKSI